MHPTHESAIQPTITTLMLCGILFDIIRLI